jgi:hypothetical protein
MNNPNCTSTTDSIQTPTRYCPCCGERTAVLVQEYIYKGKQIAAPVTAYTCQESSCPLWLQTISDTSNLDVYGAARIFDSITGVALNG